MNELELINKLLNLNVSLSVINNELVINAPRGVISEDLLVDLKNNKSGVVKFLLDNTNREKCSIIKHAEKRDYYPQSSAQKRMYLLYILDNKSTSYNIFDVIHLGHEVKKEKLEETFRKIILRHECLRTSFHLVNEEMIQKIHPFSDFHIEYYKIKQNELVDLKKSFTRSFDLAALPLFRVGYVEIESSNPILLFDIHHIISDGVSGEIFQNEFISLYNNKSVPLLSLQYKDYTLWQHEAVNQDIILKQEAYWLSEFKGNIPVLDLPYDFQRPKNKSFEGASVDFGLGESIVERLRLLLKSTDATTYMFVLSVFHILASKLSNQNDILIGMPVAGRNHPDLKDIMGLFVNTLIIRNSLNGEQTFECFLHGVKDKIIRATDNQDYQLENLIDKLGIIRDMSRNPLFDLVCNMVRVSNEDSTVKQYDRERTIHQQGVAKFDLYINILDLGKDIVLNFVYSTKLFKSETANKFIEYFIEIVNQVVNDKYLKVKDIKLLNNLKELEFGISREDAEFNF